MKTVSWAAGGFLLILAWFWFWLGAVVPRVSAIPPERDDARFMTFVPVVVASQRDESLPTATATITPLPARAPTGAVLSGTASWYGSWCNCTAMTDQRWRGHLVRVSGPRGTADVLINDAGPVPSLHRVIDLNPSTFQRVCGPLTLGLCTVSVSLLR